LALSVLVFGRLARTSSTVVEITTVESWQLLISHGDLHHNWISWITFNRCDVSNSWIL